MQRVNKLAKIRFKGYDISLERKTIGDITTSFSGGTPKSSNKSYYEGNIPFIRSGEVKSKQTELFISDEALNNSSAKLVEKGDILYALYGATSGEVAISRINGAINQAILAIKPKPGYSSEFIMNYLKKEKDNILEKYLQGGQGNLSAAIVKSIELSLPSQEEQSAIGNLFRTLDDLLASYKDNLANYQSLKATMLSKMFPKAGQTVPEIRLDGFEGEWERKNLSEGCNINSGRDYKHLKNGDIPVYGTGGYMLSVNDKLSDEDAIGIGRKGTIDKPYLLSAPFWTVDTLFYVTCKVGYDLYYLFLIFQKVRWKKFDESTGVPSLSKKTIEKVVSKFPSLPEQQAIGSYFSNLDNLINSHQEKISQLETLKKKLLQDMFI